jgi:hypothetical protein
MPASGTLRSMKLLHCACIVGAAAVLSLPARGPSNGGETWREPARANAPVRAADAASSVAMIKTAPVELTALDEFRADPVVAQAPPLPSQEAIAGRAETPVERAAAAASAAALPAQPGLALADPPPAAALPPTRFAYAVPDVTRDLIPSAPPPNREAPDFAYLADYAYSEAPPPEAPADAVLRALQDVPQGTPREEVRRAARIFGLDVTFMEAVAKIESDFDPKQRTGSYMGLFQLSKYEFDRYGSGEITDARANAVAGAYKFAVAAILFEIETHKKATLPYLYLIHQQGTQGAAEHVAHPERLAWESMCATDEGRVKGERWCKRAIWQNTLPLVKKLWGSVEKLPSAAFIEMWRDRLVTLYARYSAGAAAAAR